MRAYCRIIVESLIHLIEVTPEAGYTVRYGLTGKSSMPKTERKMQNTKKM